MIDLFEIPDFLDESTRRFLHAELDRSAGAPATVLSEDAGGVVRSTTRKASRVTVREEIRVLIRERLMEYREDLAEMFGRAVQSCEEPQFLRYETGDFFVAHQDGNTPLVWDESRFRRISAVIFLSQMSDDEAPDTYGGGMLVFHGPYTGPELRVPASARPGSLVAFRSETTHEVTPVTHGVRYTIATWFR